MPLDPSIPLSARAPTFNTPFENLGQMMQLRQQQQYDTLQQQRIAENEKQAEQQRKQQERDAAIQDAIGKIKGGNAQEVLAGLQPDARMIAEKWLNDSADNKWQRESLQRKDIQERAQLIRGFGYDPTIAGVVFGLTSDDYPEAAEIWKAIGNDPAKLKQAVDAYADLGKEPAKVESREVKTRNPDGSETIQIVADTPGQSFTSSVPISDANLGSIEDYVARYAEDKGKTPKQLSPLDIRRAKAEYDASGRAPAGGGPQPGYQWVVRDGKPVHTNAVQSGDEPLRAQFNTGDTAQDRQRDARTAAAKDFLGRLNELRVKINTKMGPEAGLTGLVRRGGAAVGMDPDVAEYERIRAAGGRSLAVAIMGAQNLSDADASAWSNMLPDARTDEQTAGRLTAQVERMLVGMTSSGKPATEPAASSTAGRPVVGQKRTANGETRTWNGSSWVK